MKAPDIKDIYAAAERIQAHIHHTPVLTCQALNAMTGAELYFKCENFQKVGAFKIRGATNAVMLLSDAEAAHGVATHSSGNHAAALALAARGRGIAAYVVMPENAPAIKKAAVAGYGAEIIPCAANLAAREQGLAEVVARTGAVFIPPYDAAPIIAGQGTAALELYGQVTALDAVIAPVGGGGLLSGTALALKALSPATQVIAAEPRNADDAYQSIRTGRIVPSIRPDTIADGLRTSLGELTFPIIQHYVDDIITVSESNIIAAMRHIWERMKIIVEPSAAVTLAVLLEQPERLAGKRVGLMLSGGNVDLDRLPWQPC
jgi:threonine dehydratase